MKFAPKIMDMVQCVTRGLQKKLPTWAKLASKPYPAIEVTGRLPGPRMCVLAGIHVNEASSIEAAIELHRAIDPKNVRGKISIIPIVNVSARFTRSTEAPEVIGATFRELDLA